MIVSALMHVENTRMDTVGGEREREREHAYGCTVGGCMTYLVCFGVCARVRARALVRALHTCAWIHSGWMCVCARVCACTGAVAGAERTLACIAVYACCA